MQNLLNDLTNLLEQDIRLVSEGKLLKNKVVELALALDAGLIKLLLQHAAIRSHFFVEVEGVLVFDKIRFQKFVSNKQFLPDSYTAFKNKIGLTANSEYLTESKEVVLAWPYKDCVLEGGQDKEDAKRNEMFWNETLAPDQIDRLLSPKALTGFKRYDKDGEHHVADLSPNDNFIIKGNNLLALHTLRKVYAGKVKLIYIDPPYNTGSDSFHYNDSFNHSAWLTFMRNRLEISYKLLASDGYICIQCSFHEYAYLKTLCDGLFGEKRWRATFNVLVRHPDRTLTGDKEFNDVVEYTLVYSQSENQRLPSIKELKVDDDYVYQIELVKPPHTTLTCDAKEVEVYLPDQYRVLKKDPSSNLLKSISIRGSLKEKNSSGRFFVKHLESLSSTYPPLTLFKVPNMGDDAFGHRFFYLPKEGNKNGTYFQGMPQSTDTTERPYPNFLDFVEEYNIVNSEGGVEFRNGKKPESLIAYYMEMLTNQNDLVLDYYLGSGTTAATAHKMGRRYIGIDQMDYIKEVSLERMKGVIQGEASGISNQVDWQGGGSFVYCELSQANQLFIDQIQAAKSSEDLQAIWQAMQERAFLSYKLDPKTIDANKSEFASLAFADQKRFLIEVLDKNLLYVPYSEIDDASYAVTDADKALNRQLFNLK